MSPHCFSELLQLQLRAKGHDYTISRLDCSLLGAIGLHYAHLRLGLGLGPGLGLGLGLGLVLGLGVGLALVFSEI